MFLLEKDFDQMTLSQKTIFVLILIVCAVGILSL